MVARCWPSTSSSTLACQPPPGPDFHRLLAGYRGPRCRIAGQNSATRERGGTDRREQHRRCARPQHQGVCDAPQHMGGSTGGRSRACTAIDAVRYQRQLAQPPSGHPGAHAAPHRCGCATPLYSLPPFVWVCLSAGLCVEARRSHLCSFAMQTPAITWCAGCCSQLHGPA